MQGINDLLAEHQPDDLLSDQISDSTAVLGDEQDGDLLSDASRSNSRTCSPQLRPTTASTAVALGLAACVEARSCSALL